MNVTLNRQPTRAFALVALNLMLFASSEAPRAQGQAFLKVQKADRAIPSMAEQLAQALHNFKAKRVLILDLRGTQVDDTTQAQNKLGADFSSTNGHAVGKNEASAWASNVKADAVVTGSCARLGDTLRIALDTFSVRHADKDVTSIGALVEISDQIRTLSPQPIPSLNGTSAETPKGGTPPQCERCPQPACTDKARRAHFEGSVTFEIIVDSNGDVENPIVVNTPGYGLEQKALGAVRKWKLKPARGSDGNPIPAAVILEVVFRCT